MASLGALSNLSCSAAANQTGRGPGVIKIEGRHHYPPGAAAQTFLAQPTVWSWLKLDGGSGEASAGFHSRMEMERMGRPEL
jgi:hypothetical protein